MKQKEENCGTCARLGVREGKYGPETYCRLDGKKRNRHEMKGCLGWKERK
jgi:hypothetical protein